MLSTGTAGNATNPNNVSLPKTSLPLRSSRAIESEIIQKWAQKPPSLTEQPTSKETFILHDGPIYANGPLHMGHALNRIRKDFENRCAMLKGKKVIFVPGWDCHGLPIEHKVEKKLKQEKRYPVSSSVIRDECRAFATDWVQKQKEGFLEYGIYGNFDKPYLTMEPPAEITIVNEFHKLVRNDLIYRAKRPVWWSCAEGTSLAEAEMEYTTKTSTAIDVTFEIVHGSHTGTIVPIWTTTPWTITANEAVAFSTRHRYDLVLTDDNRKFCIATDLKDAFFARIGLNYSTLEEDIKFCDTKVRNPLNKIVPLLHAEFVTTDSGTGFVHTAPGHGPDDFTLGTQHNLPISEAISPQGHILNDQLLKFAENPRLHFTEADEIVCKFLGSKLLHAEKFTHQGPISWRSKTPLVYRATYQWFIDISKIRSQALKMIDDIQWVPASSRARIKAMMSNRGDWCISRQRSWGVPIAVHYNPNTGEIYKESLPEIVDFISKNRSDAWFDDRGKVLDRPGLERATDIMDVWIESGLSNRILRDQSREKIGIQLNPPYDIYLEGSDQHRGWFQSSIALAAANNMPAPCKKVLTHGFVVDHNGHKMSKSLGNVIDPQKIIEQHGPDVLRIMVLGTKLQDDMRLGLNAITNAKARLARFRMTLRYILGTLSQSTNNSPCNTQPLAPETRLCDFEQWILSRACNIDKEFWNHVANHESDQALILLYEFCDKEVSGIYFDVRKDTLYCELQSHPTRISAICCMEILFQYLLSWLAPIAPFLVEEILGHYKQFDFNVVNNISELQRINLNLVNTTLEERYTQALEIRKAVNKKIELLCEQKILTESHAANVKYKGKCDLPETAMKELCIVSKFEYSIINPIKSSDESNPDQHYVEVNLAPGTRCPRCKFRFESSRCQRCDEVVKASS